MTMKSLWNLGLPMMMEKAGKKCRATLNGVTVSFHGILDQVETMETDDFGGQFSRMVSVLRIDKTTGLLLKGEVNTEIMVDGVSYIANQPISEDDGETFIVVIYPAEMEKRV